jgi:hypothetical protein
MLRNQDRIFSTRTYLLLYQFFSYEKIYVEVIL